MVATNTIKYDNVLNDISIQSALENYRVEMMMI